MIALLSSLGAGVALAYLALPVLAATARPSLGASPASRHRLLLTVLALDVALVLVPLVWQWSVQIFGGRLVLMETPRRTLSALRVMQLHSGSLVAHGLTALGALWVVVTFVAAAIAARRLLHLAQLLRRAKVASEDDCVLGWKLARQMGLPPPQILLSEESSIPFAVALGRPVVVLPGATRRQLGPEALGFVLRHELTHIARGDPSAALLSSILRLPLALHPTAHALMRELTLAREEAVDAAVAPSGARAYAQTLVEVASLTQLGPRSPEAVFMSDSSLKRRIGMLLEPKTRKTASLLPTLMAALVLGLGGLAAPRVLADEPAMSAPLKLGVGKQKVLTLQQVEKIAVGDPSIAEIQALSETQLLITGVAQGQTTLVVFTNNGAREAFTIVVE